MLHSQAPVLDYTSCRSTLFNLLASPRVCGRVSYRFTSRYRGCVYYPLGFVPHTHCSKFCHEALATTDLFSSRYGLTHLQLSWDPNFGRYQSRNCSSLSRRRTSHPWCISSSQSHFFILYIYRARLTWSTVRKGSRDSEKLVRRFQRVVSSWEHISSSRLGRR